ncbi:tubby [Nematocida sp. AWRm77]|nr:tubby [Nematocida sp. AWRm77]
MEGAEELNGICTKSIAQEMTFRDGDMFGVIAEERELQLESEEHISAGSRDELPVVGEMRRGRVRKSKGCFFTMVEYVEENGGEHLIAEKSGFGWRIQGPDGKKAAVMKANFTGTKYTLRRSEGEKETCCIEYTGLFNNGGPRSFQVFIDPSNKHHSRALSKRVKEKKAQYVRLVNKQPYYNLESNSYVLNFNGRVTLPSVRNFQIIHPRDTSYITMIFGKTGENEYVLDYTYPWSALEAFSVALSSMGIKLGYE